jgi:hypothetical protein
MTDKSAGEALLPCPWCGVMPKHDSSSDEVWCVTVDCPAHEILAVSFAQWNLRASPQPSEPAVKPRCTARRGGKACARDVHHTGECDFTAAPVAAGSEDDPLLDATDFAHPAWWRAHDHTFKTFCAIVTAILDGRDDGRGAYSEPWATVRQRLVALVRTAHPEPAAAEKWAMDKAEQFYAEDPDDGTLHQRVLAKARAYVACNCRTIRIRTVATERRAGARDGPLRRQVPRAADGRVEEVSGRVASCDGAALYTAAGLRQWRMRC